MISRPARMAVFTLLVAGLLGAAVGAVSQLTAVSVEDPRPSVPPPIPSSTPAPTPTPTPPGPWRYTVQAGESLSAIAIRFGTTTEELISLNPEYADSQDLIEAGASVIVPCTPIAQGEARC